MEKTFEQAAIEHLNARRGVDDYREKNFFFRSDEDGRTVYFCDREAFEEHVNEMSDTYQNPRPDDEEIERMWNEENVLILGSPYFEVEC